MELRHLKYFVMVAEEGNVSRAAARLNISQPAVYRQIKDLETELGVELFLREHNGLRLTEAGNFALLQARELLRQANGLQSAMQTFAKQTKTMSLKIGYLPTALPGFLTKALRQFNEEHQYVCVQIEEMNPVHQESALARGEIDLALLGTATASWNKKYRTEIILSTPVAIALPDDHKLSTKKRIDLSELKSDVFVSLDPNVFPGRPEMEADLFDRAKIAPTIALKARGLSELLGHVGAGTGAALIPSDLNHLPHAGVAIRPLKTHTAQLTFSAVWREDQQTSELLALIKMLKTQ